MLKARQATSSTTPDDYYVKVVYCDNCGRDNTLWIPLGVRMVDCDFGDCWNCKCRIEAPTPQGG